MIQEKDFLYRVPVKNALVTAPGKQVRNPEILVDLEGGEFMHGNILDANSTNKLVNQGNEDLSSKIKAERTRAEGKEKEISDKLAIVDGDSNTEGSFRKAIADVIAAAPEDLDTLKEIADKLAGNDDLHTALNQAITEKADASALANEVARATGAESGLQAAIATKADATALSNYVLTTALNQQVDTLNTAISAKQDAGNYIKYERIIGDYGPDGRYLIHCGIHLDTYPDNSNVIIDKDGILVSKYGNSSEYSTFKDDIITTRDYKAEMHIASDQIASYEISKSEPTGLGDANFQLTSDGVRLYGGDGNHVLTSNASTIDITQYALKSELPTVPTKTSQLTNDSNFITAADADSRYALSDTADSLSVGLSKKQDKITVNNVDVTDIETADITKLRTIVTNLINALSASGLIKETETLE